MSATHTPASYTLQCVPTISHITITLSRTFNKNQSDDRTCVTFCKADWEVFIKYTEELFHMILQFEALTCVLENTFRTVNTKASRRVAADMRQIIISIEGVPTSETKKICTQNFNRQFTKHPSTIGRILWKTLCSYKNMPITVEILVSFLAEDILRAVGSYYAKKVWG